MAKGNGKESVRYSSPFNETGSGGPEKADMTGDAIYWGGYPEMLKMHLKEWDMASTPNSRSGDDILGTPTTGEPQVMKGK
jgi:hypothetical protein